MKPLSSLIPSINPIKINGSLNINISSICYDSRLTVPGCLYVPQTGSKVDGHTFIDEAIKKGARAVLYCKEHVSFSKDITYLKVKNTTVALSAASASFYDFPSKQLPVIGITGTNGKSTTSYMIYQLFKSLGISCGLISTVHSDIGRGIRPNPDHVTTPLSLELQKSLYQMIGSKLEIAVVEASSWGLSNTSNRLRDVEFQSGVFTNFSHDHIDLHGNEREYFNSKLNLFRKINSQSGFAIAPPELKIKIKKVTKAPIYLFGKRTSCDIKNDEYNFNWACQINKFSENNTGVVFDIEAANERIQIKSKLLGYFNVLNCLAAISVVLRYCKIPLSDLSTAISSILLPPGHMEEIILGQPFRVIIDYAHTPHAFEATLSYLRNKTFGRVISVFGSAGERDILKRPMQGRIACKYSDIVILTDEDCRTEDPNQILNDIAAGCTEEKEKTNLILEPDREKAISYALKIAQRNDSVILLGKGHEASMIQGTKSHNWNEKSFAEATLQKIGFK